MGRVAGVLAIRDHDMKAAFPPHSCVASSGKDTVCDSEVSRFASGVRYRNQQATLHMIVQGQQTMRWWAGSSSRPCCSRVLLTINLDKAETPEVHQLLPDVHQISIAWKMALAPEHPASHCVSMRDVGGEPGAHSSRIALPEPDVLRCS